MEENWRTDDPEKPGCYLVTKIDRYDGENILDIAEWYETKKRLGGGSKWNKESPVIAWMPLPEPYKGREGRRKIDK